MDFLIYGSCVSRDAFEFSGSPKFIDYFARSSILSSMDQKPCEFEELDFSANPSAFQRRMVEEDMSKGLAAALQVREGAAVLVDLIDDRFDVGVSESGASFTVSPELVTTGFDAAGFKLIKFGSEEYLKLFPRRWARFLQLVDSKMVVVNKVFWAEEDHRGERLPGAEKIKSANETLKRVYEIIEIASPEVGWIHYDAELLRSDPGHKWGISPFHFIPAFYRHTVNQLQEWQYKKRVKDSDLPPTPKPLSGRKVTWCNAWAASGADRWPILETDRIRLDAGSGEPVITESEVSISVVAEELGKEIVRQVVIELPDRPTVSGYGTRIRLQGWKDISYVALGHRAEGVYHHVKVSHPLANDWFDLDVGFRDLAWGWRNSWQYLDDQQVDEVRLFVKGVPAPSASIGISSVRVWRESNDHASTDAGVIDPNVLANLIDYQRQCFPDYAEMAYQYLEHGKCPLSGGVILDWPLASKVPPELNSNGTFQYSWHALHPAVFLMLLSEDEQGDRALYAARELIVNWLDGLDESIEGATRYSWYDLGVAERTLALVTMYGVGSNKGFDRRFMDKLQAAIVRHAQLLASEVFYTGFQVSRYHNHAWFQDFALIVTATAFPSWSGAAYWFALAVTRLRQQFAVLVAREDGYAVFTENSVGYDLGIARILANIAKFTEMTELGDEAASILEELNLFSSLLR